MTIVSQLVCLFPFLTSCSLFLHTRQNDPFICKSDHVNALDKTSLGIPIGLRVKHKAFPRPTGLTHSTPGYHFTSRPTALPSLKLLLPRWPPCCWSYTLRASKLIVPTAWTLFMWPAQGFLQISLLRNTSAKSLPAYLKEQSYNSLFP